MNSLPGIINDALRQQSMSSPYSPTRKRRTTFSSDPSEKKNVEFSSPTTLNVQMATLSVSQEQSISSIKQTESTSSNMQVEFAQKFHSNDLTLREIKGLKLSDGFHQYYLSCKVSHEGFFVGNKQNLLTFKNVTKLMESYLKAEDKVVIADRRHGWTSNLKTIGERIEKEVLKTIKEEELLRGINTSGTPKFSAVEKRMKTLKLKGFNMFVDEDNCVIAEKPITLTIFLNNCKFKS